MLLGLTDDNIISLNGQPTWFTMCPMDPNLPPRPEPVHYKHNKNKSVEQLLSKFKKAWNLANNPSGGNSSQSIKTSVSMSGGIHDLESGSVSRHHHRGLNLTATRNSREQMTKQLQSYDSGFMNLLQSEVSKEMVTHTINEAKLAKLNSILNVLRGADNGGEGEEGDNGGASSDIDTCNQQAAAAARSSLPKFVSIFESEKFNSDDETSVGSSGSGPARRRKQQRRNKLSKAMLQVLESSAVDAECSSDSGDNLDNLQASDSTDGGSSRRNKVILNQQSRAWLDESRRRSDSFQKIPKLRESLNAGKLNKVTNYSFDDSGNGGSAPYSRGSSGLSHSNHMTHGKSHMTSVEELENEATAVEKPQVHYKLVDTKDDRDSKYDDKDSPPSSLQSKFASPDCKCYPVPVEVSLHRISIIDVDNNTKEELWRTKSCDERNRTPKSSRRTLPQEEDISAIEGSKIRSKSLGDMEKLDFNEEVLVVKSPRLNRKLTEPALMIKETVVPVAVKHRSEPFPAPPSEKRASLAPERRVHLNEKKVTVEEEEEEVSSLDFTKRPKFQVPLRDVERLKRRSKSFFTASIGSDDGALGRSWGSNDVGSWGSSTNCRKSASMSKCHSLDNIVDMVPESRPK